MKLSLSNLLPSCSALVLLSAVSAAAQVITYTGENASVPATANNVATNYYLYLAAALPSGTAATLSNLPSYVTLATGGNPFAGDNTTGNYSDFTLNGAEYVTGLDVFNGSGANQTAATLTLTGTVPASFSFSVLTDNIAPGTNGVTNDQNIITVAGTGLTATFGSQGSNTVGTGFNDLYTYDVTGAAAGDVITISVKTPGTSFSEIGGILFNDTVSAPEPSTWALLLASGGALLFLARRKRSLFI